MFGKITIVNIFKQEKPININFLQSFNIKNMIFISFLYLANPKIIMKSLLLWLYISQYKRIKNIKESYQIEKSLYDEYNVKRGLRNNDGSGVLVGLTRIGNVHGYIKDEHEIVPVEGKLRYRGIEIR